MPATEKQRKFVVDMLNKSSISQVSEIVALIISQKKASQFVKPQTADSQSANAEGLTAAAVSSTA